MKIQKGETGITSKSTGQENIKRLVYVLPLVILTVSITMSNAAYASVYGYYATEPSAGTWSNLSDSTGDIYTYTGNMNGAGNYAHINRMVYLTDVSSYSVGTGYYDGTTGTGTEYYKFMYYVDDGTTSDNLTYLASGIPSSGTTYNADVDKTSGGGTHDFTFYIAGTSKGSYTCTYSCTNAVVVAGASAWGDGTSTTENIRTDISGLHLGEDGNTPISWSSDGGEIKCDGSDAYVNLASNEFTANGAGNGCTSNPNDGWLYNNQLGG